MVGRAPALGRVGIVGGIPACTPQFQNVVRRLCGEVARLSPAIILNLGGKGRILPAVRLR